MPSKRSGGLTVLVAVCAWTVAPAEAFQCPILIQDAETALNLTKASTTDPKGRWLLEEATALVNDAKARHRGAKSADDHNRAIAKARIARAAAELAQGQSR